MKPLIVALSIVVFLGFYSGTALGQPCSLDVFGLNVEESVIVGNIKNTGAASENITFELFVNNEIVSVGSIPLEPEEVGMVSNEFSFPPGEYIITLEAASSCGAFDSETIEHVVLEDFACFNPSGFEGQNFCRYSSQEYQVCLEQEWHTLDQNGDQYCINCPLTCGDGVCNCGEDASTCSQDCAEDLPQICVEKFINKFRCDDDILQQKFVFSDCGEEFVSLRFCQFGCEEGLCLPPKPISFPPFKPIICDVSLEGLDFVNNFKIWEKGHVTVKVLNTGSKATLKLNFTLDGLSKGKHTLQLASGGESSKTFFYRTSAGNHVGEVTVSHPCGTEDSDVFHVTVFKGEQVITFTPPLPPPSEEEGETSVAVLPPSLDVPLYQGKVVSLDIQSSVPQNFLIDVSPLPEGFVSFDQTVFIEKEGKAFVYITPTTLGSYRFTVSATAEKEGKTFSRDIELFVVPFGARLAEETPSAGILPLFIAVVAIVIVAIIVIASLYKKREEQYWNNLLKGEGF